MARSSEGLSVPLGPRVQPDEAQMIKDIAAMLGVSQNRGIRWAIRFAHEHATSTADHLTDCRGMSPCANATKGLAPTKAARVPEGQTVITHQATVEHHDDQHQAQRKRQL